MDTLRLAALADHELLLRLRETIGHSRRAEAALIACMAEIDSRRIYARLALPSMSAYCRQVLRLSQAEAHLRIAAARASHEHPDLLWLLADGRLSLSAIVALAPYLTHENRDALLERAVYRTKREIRELVAGLAPKPPATAPVCIPVPSYLSGEPDEAELMEAAARDQDEEDAEAELFGTLERLANMPDPEGVPLVSTPQYVPAPARGEGWERPRGRRCRFLDVQGRRCPERVGFSPDNLGGLCPAHHRHRAVREHGRAATWRYWRSRPGSS